jgi:hypothetical protein
MRLAGFERHAWSCLRQWTVLDKMSGGVAGRLFSRTLPGIRTGVAHCRAGEVARSSTLRRGYLRAIQ